MNDTGGDSRSRLELRLLDGFAITCAGGPLLVPLPAQRLLALLAVAARPVSREVAGERLWSNRPPERAAANLRAAVSRLRTIPDAVRVTRTHLQVGAEVDLDADRAAALARRLLGGADGVPVDPAESVDLLGRELLPDWPDEWVEPERERLRQLTLGALEQLSESLRQEGRFALAVDAALAAIRLDPMRERAHEALIEAHLAAGNRSAAIGCFRWLQQLLSRDLGLRPRPDLEDRVRAVLAPPTPPSQRMPLR